MKALTGTITGALLLTLFFLYPLLADPFGENPYGPLFERPTSDTGAIRHPGFCGLEISMEDVNLPRIKEMEIRVNGRSTKWNFTLGRRDYEQHALIGRPAEGESLPKEGLIFLEAPFTVHFRPLYDPSFLERIAIVGRRLVIWRPLLFRLLFLPAIFLFSFAGLYAAWRGLEPEADSPIVNRGEAVVNR